jgi:hypothetical protein
MISYFTSKPAFKPLKQTATCASLWAGLFAGAALAATAGSPALAEGPGKIPDLASSSSFAWTPLTARGTIARYGTGWFDPPGGLRGPIKQHPDYPLRGNDTGRPTPALGNYKDPILKPWAAEKMRLSNEELLSGKTGIPFLPQSRCWPGGVPGQLLWTTEPLYFIQGEKQVMMLWQRDQWWRRIDLTDKHSEHIRPSRYGESIGRYENGELVIDTIGIAAKKNSVIDMFRTPHTDKLHVTERYKVTANNEYLEALVRIEDEDTFNEPMYMAKRWRREPNVWRESICAEGGQADPFGSNFVPIPQADKPDF